MVTENLICLSTLQDSSIKKLQKIQQKYFYLHISSSYDKILGKHIFSLGSFPEVGQKQKTEKKKERKKERLNNGNNNGQLRIAMPPRLAHVSRLGQ